MAEMIYYRLHHGDAPCFCADHAWSAVWGAEFTTPDGSQHKCTSCLNEPGQSDAPCPGCDGYGWSDCSRCEGNGYAECDRCEGTGHADSDRGYSCCASASALVEYMRSHAGGDLPDDDHWQVVVFEGEWQGPGGDEGEHLVVPTRVVETLTWSQLILRAETEEEAT